MSNKTKILVNFAKLKKGGGQNVALNFLNGLCKVNLDKFELSFIVADNSGPHVFLQNSGEFKYFVAPSNSIYCLFWEALFSLRKLRSGRFDVIYTYFGYSFFLFGNTFQVSGSADSNLFYPEVDFWKGEPALKRCFRWLVDKYRIYGLKKSEAIIFENPDMQKKGKNIFGLKFTKLVLPSITGNSQMAKRTRLFSKDNLNILLLCGWQRNKGILKVPEIIVEAKKQNINLIFTLTAGKVNCAVGVEFKALVDEFGVQKNINIVDPVKKEDLAATYNKCDFVMLLSKLESFSNNIIEAWYYKVPLIVANESWSKAICNNAAIYVDRENPEVLVSALCDYIEHSELRNEKIRLGILELEKYPLIEERIIQELNYVSEFKTI